VVSSAPAREPKVKAQEQADAGADLRALAASKVAFMVTTQPPGALVIFEGTVRGETPVNLSFETLEQRQIELLLRKDRFDDLPVVLSLGPELGGQALVVNHVLVRKKGTVGRDPFRDL